MSRDALVQDRKRTYGIKYKIFNKQLTISIQYSMGRRHGFILSFLGNRKTRAAKNPRVDKALVRTKRRHDHTEKELWEIMFMEEKRQPFRTNNQSTHTKLTKHRWLSHTPDQRNMGSTSYMAYNTERSRSQTWSFMIKAE